MKIKSTYLTNESRVDSVDDAVNNLAADVAQFLGVTPGADYVVNPNALKSDLPNTNDFIHVSQKGAPNGVAALNSNGLVLQDPASANAVPGAFRIPRADASGKINASWIAGGFATLDHNNQVIQDPANAVTTPAALKIPKADGTGKISAGWLAARPFVSLYLPGALLPSGNTCVPNTWVENQDNYNLYTPGADHILIPSSMAGLWEFGFHAFGRIEDSYNVNNSFVLARVDSIAPGQIITPVASATYVTSIPSHQTIALYSLSLQRVIYLPPGQETRIRASVGARSDIGTTTLVAIYGPVLFGGVWVQTSSFFARRLEAA